MHAWPAKCVCAANDPPVDRPTSTGRASRSAVSSATASVTICAAPIEPGSPKRAVRLAAEVPEQGAVALRARRRCDQRLPARRVPGQGLKKTKVRPVPRWGA